MGKREAIARGEFPFFRFADLTLDTGRHIVARNAQSIRLPKLTYDFLLALVEGAPNVVTHEDLVERVWRGRVVSPGTVAQRMRLLRQALGDHGTVPRYFRTVRGLGYQLIPPVRTPHGLGASAGAGSILKLSSGEQSLAADIDVSLPAQPSVVVLPFESNQADVEQRDFARGLTHDIMTRIARTRSFFVIARGTAFQFASRSCDIRAIGRLLGIRYVVQGYVRVSSGMLSINVALAETTEGKEVWAEHFYRKLDEVFETQQEMTNLIVGALSSEIELAEQGRALLEASTNLDAWSAYHRGCWHMYRFTAEDYEQAERFFKLAVSLDPNSARALAGLSFVHWQRAFLEIFRDRHAEVQKAFELAQQSVCLNPYDPLGHWALGRAHLLRGEVKESIIELSTSTELNPSFAVGQYTLGFALMHSGDLTSSVARADKARRLSPLDPMGFAMLALRGFSLALAGQHEKGAELTSRALRRPNAHYHIVAMAAVCSALAGNSEAARATFGRLRRSRPGYGADDFLRAFRFQQPAHRRLIHKAFRRLVALR